MSAYDTLVAALERHGCRVVTRYGKTTAQCPAHGSNGLKLAISQRRDGAGIVVKCWSADCAAADVVAAVGLGLRDLFDGDLPPGYVPPPRREPSPWDPITLSLGVEHMLDRMVAQERRAAGLAAIPLVAAPHGPPVPDRAAMSHMPPERADAYAAWVLSGGADDE